MDHKQVAYPTELISKLVLALNRFECDSMDVMFCEQCVQQILARLELEGLLFVDRRDLVVVMSWAEEAMTGMVPALAPDPTTKGFVEGVLHKLSNMIGLRNASRTSPRLPGVRAPQAEGTT